VVGLEWYPCCRLKPAILFHYLCAQHASDIHTSIIRSLRLCVCANLLYMYGKSVPLQARGAQRIPGS